MKKLLLFLLIPLLSFGQDFTLKHEILEQGPFEPGDVITVKYTLTDVAGNIDLKLLQFDTGYDDTKLVRQGTPNWVISTPTNKSLASNYWTGYSYNPDGTYDPENLRTGVPQFWSGGGTTAPSRYTIQSTDDIEGELFLQQFKILDADNYSEALGLKWATVTEQDTNFTDFIIKPDPNLYIDLGQVGDIPAGTVTFKVNLPDYTNAEDYMILIETLDQYQDMQNGGSIQDYTSIEGSFDLSGNFTTTELSQDIPYIVNVFIKADYDQQTQEVAHPTWLDDVVTVSDVILTFKEAIGANVDGTGTTLDHPFQRFLANVSHEGFSDPVNFEDSYAMLAHLVGVLDNSADSMEFDPDREFYPITSFNNGSFNVSAFIDKLGMETNSEDDWLAQRSFTLTSTDPTEFTLGHALMGDVDLSHSSTPLTSNTVSKGFRKFNLKTIDTDVDVTSELKDGLVELNIDVTKDDLTGMQLNLSYDKSILTFKEVIFDTGNAMTNFAKPLDGKIIVGTIDPQVKQVMKAGRPFKVVFETKQTISNTAGLISFDVTDAVTIDGTKVNLNIR